MSENYQNNPLHGLNLETLLTQLVDHYGWEILAAATNFNCFKLNPTIKGSMKFLKKTDWARQKLEIFYLYRFKNLPKPDRKQADLPPRDRIIPDDHTPGEPVVLTLEKLEQENQRKAEKAREFEQSRRGSANPANKSPRRSTPRKPTQSPRTSAPESSSSRPTSPSRPSSSPARSTASSKPKPQRRESDQNPSADLDPWAAARKKFDQKNG